jgi:hypothetical protein
VNTKDGRVAERQKFKKQKHVPPLSIIDFFGGGPNYFKKDLVQLRFIEDSVFLVCKGYQNISVVESFWLRRLVMKRNPKVKFPTHSQFVSKHLLEMVVKTTNGYVLPLLTKCETANITFDL